MGCGESKVARLIGRKDDIPMSGKREEEESATGFGYKHMIEVVENAVPDSKAEPDADPQFLNNTGLNGLCRLPWHIVEEIILESVLSYPDAVAIIQAYAPNDQAGEEIISSDRLRILWETKFRQLYPDLYRLLCGSRIAGHEMFSWYHLLKKRWEAGQSVERSLKAFRDKNMEETLALLEIQEDNLAEWFTESQAGDPHDLETEVETETSSIPQDHTQPGRKGKAIVFVGNGRLAEHDFHRKLQFLFYNRALANMVLGDDADRYDLTRPVPNAEVPLLTKLMVVDACREHAKKKRFPTVEDGPTYDMLNTMEMCQTAVGYHQIYLYIEHLTEMFFGVQPKKGIPEDFFALISFLQACYPHRRDVLIDFYKNAFDIRNVTFGCTTSTKAMGQVNVPDMVQVNGMLRGLDAELLADDLAFACGFACNFPYISIQSDNLPPIVSFLFLAVKFLSSEFVTVTMHKLALGITVQDAGNVCTYWDDIYVLLPCVSVDGVDYYCIPNRLSRLPHIFKDKTKLAVALHRILFNKTNEQFGSVRDVRIISVIQGSLMDHFRSYMKYLVNTNESTQSRIFESIYTQSKSHGGSVIVQFCLLFSNMDLMGLMPYFFLCHAWTKSKRGQSQKHRNPSATIAQCGSVLPIGTVVRIKYRKITAGDHVDGPQHFAVVVSWNIEDRVATSGRAPTPRITYHVVCLGRPHPDDPYYPDTCARIAKKLTVVDKLPADVQEGLFANPVLWRLFDSFDGMFFIPQPALKKKFPDDFTKQEELRKINNYAGRIRGGLTGIRVEILKGRARRGVVWFF